MEIRKITENNTQAALTRTLIEASKRYYDGNPLMDDHFFDQEVERLRKMEEESGFAYEGSPTVAVGAEVSSDLKPVTHEFPALSLGKVKYKDRESLKAWLKDSEGHDSAIMSWKLDGSTVVLTYDNGKLTLAATRGQNGQTGGDITHNAPFIQGIPMEIDYKDHLVVRGEAVMEFAEFERINSELPADAKRYENPRNLATSTIGAVEGSDDPKNRHCRFIAFELVSPQPEEGLLMADPRPFPDVEDFNLKYQQDRFDWLEILGFDVVQHECADSTDILQKIDEWQEETKALEYPTDGLVITYNDMVYGMSLGNTEHHFRHSLALKWTDETKTSTLRGIEWSAEGKTGKIVPVAIFDTVRLGLGSNVSRASLHNVSIMKRMPVTGTEFDEDGVKYQPLMIGSKVEVYLANMIIPQIASVSGGDNEIEIPTTCPVCGWPAQVVGNYLEGVAELYCINKQCPAKQVGNLVSSFSKEGLNAKGLAESQIKDLLDAGLVDSSVVSFYQLANEGRAHTQNPREDEFSAKVSNLWKKDGWGKKKWDNLILAIEKSRKATLQKFLYSLNISLLGNDLSKKLAKYWNNDVNQFIDFIEDVVYAEGKKKGLEVLCAIDGVGDEKANNIVDWAWEMLDAGKWQDILCLVKELEFPKVTNIFSDTSLDGLTFVITGSVNIYKNRDEFKASVEARGGKVAGRVSAKTSFLVNNDIASNSSKNQKAKSLNIPIISEQMYVDKFGK